jgi:hypothetical protein
VRPSERGWCELPGERSLGGAARRAKIPASRGPGGAADRATSRRVANPGKWWDTVRTNFFFFEFFEFLFLKKFIQNVYLESFMFVDKVFKKKFNKRFYRKTYLF